MHFSENPQPLPDSELAAVQLAQEAQLLRRMISEETQQFGSSMTLAISEAIAAFRTALPEEVVHIPHTHHALVGPIPLPGEAKWAVVEASNLQAHPPAINIVLDVYPMVDDQVQLQGSMTDFPGICTVSMTLVPLNGRMLVRNLNVHRTKRAAFNRRGTVPTEKVLPGLATGMFRNLDGIMRHLMVSLPSVYQLPVWEVDMFDVTTASNLMNFKHQATIPGWSAAIAQELGFELINTLPTGTSEWFKTYHRS